MMLAQSKATNPSAPLLLNTDDMQLGYLERQMQELAHRKTSSVRCKNWHIAKPRVHGAVLIGVSV
jgi:hypothetical protein